MASNGNGGGLPPLAPPTTGLPPRSSPSTATATATSASAMPPPPTPQSLSHTRKGPKLSRESKKPRRDEVFHHDHEAGGEADAATTSPTTTPEATPLSSLTESALSVSLPSTPLMKDATTTAAAAAAAASATSSPPTDAVEDAESKSMIGRVLREHFLFSGMGSAQLSETLRSMRRVVVPPFTVVITEGALGDYFSFVQSGRLEVTQRALPGVVDVLTPGRVFGELALIYDCPRAATVRATEDGAVLWSLSSAVFRDLAQRHLNENLERRVSQLRAVPAFSRLSNEQLRRVSAVMQEERFPAGTQIMYQGQVLVPGVNDKFYTIVQGSVVVTSSPLKRRTSAKTMVVGGVAVADANNNGAAAPSTPTSSVLGVPPASPGAAASTSAAPPTSSEGAVALGTLGPGEWFGEIALLSDAPRSANVVALGNMGAATTTGSGDTVCLTLSRGAYEQIIYPSPAQADISGFSEVRKADNHEIKMRYARDGLAASLTLDSLEMGPIIGEGGFSVVRVVKHRSSGEVFALKTMSKSTIVKRKQVEHVNNERNVLLEVSHPFIMSLIKTFNGVNHVHMVVELMQGGELFSRVLQSGGGLPPKHCAFYAACVVEGLDYLHRKGIVYRDLKLENLVIDTGGYLRIIDFGFAKKLGEGQFTRTLCGTPDYLAPESVLRKGHNQAVDVWGLGVLTYEMLTQYSPFADSSGNSDRVVTFRNILKGVHHVDWSELARPFRSILEREGASGRLSADVIRNTNEEYARARDLLIHVWNPDPLTRVTPAALKSHPFFSAFHWAHLREGLVEAPWTPDLGGPMDLKYFDVDPATAATRVDDDGAEPYDGPREFFEEFGRD